MRMLNRRYLFLIAGGLLVLLFLWWLGRGGQGPETTERRGGVVKKPVVPKVESRIPYSPTQVNLESLANVSLPQTVSTYQLQSLPQRALTLDEVELIGKNLSFSEVAEERTDSSGKRSYVFRDDRGRVLTINPLSPSLHYSELGDAGEGVPVPSLDEAKALAEEWLGKVGLPLPAGWQIREVESVYLAGHESVSVETNSRDVANFSRVRFGYLYEGTLVVDDLGREGFLVFTFGPGGSVVSAKLEFLVNDADLITQKVGEGKAKGLEEVKRDFSSGKTRAVSLDLSGVSSDEIVVSPPSIVEARDLQSVLVLSGGSLRPYFLVRAGGELASGRRGTVVYLVSSVPE